MREVAWRSPTVRGGTAQAWVQAGPPAALAVSVAAQPNGIRVDIAAQPGVTALVVAAPLEELEGMMNRSEGADLGASLRQSLAIATPDLVRAALAVTTTRDIAAPFALRQTGNTTSTIALPAPTDPLEPSSEELRSPALPANEPLAPPLSLPPPPEPTMLFEPLAPPITLSP